MLLGNKRQIVVMAEPQSYAGMTINERLYAAGLMDQFDAAARARDRDVMISILNGVAVGDAAGSIDAILRDPTLYGY